MFTNSILNFIMKIPGRFNEANRTAVQSANYTDSIIGQNDSIFVLTKRFVP